jgi:hypothetical protein
MQPKHTRIELAARQAQSGDELSIRALTDEIFTIAPELSDAIGTPLKDRIVKAELAFRSSQYPPIAETQIADGVNVLANHFGAPHYATTSGEQVADLRMSLLPAFPTLLGSHLTADDRSIHQFSPVEAACLTLLMVRQKISNPEYQVPPELWQKWKKSRKPASNNAANRRPDNSQEKAMRSLIAGQQMSTESSLALGHQVLDAIGIER